MSTIQAIKVSSAIAQLDSMFKAGGSFNPQLAGMMLAAQQYENETTRSKQLLSAATDNMKQQNYANQLNEQISALKSRRATTKSDAKDTDSVQINPALSKEEKDNLTSAFARIGVNASEENFAKVLSGNFSQTNLDALAAKVKTMQDQATNQAQIDNMNIQNSNNRQNQQISFYMSMVDQLKTQGDRIWR